MNRYLVLLLVLFFSSIALGVPSSSVVRGINYDPAHSDLYAEGFATGDQQLMQQSIDNDLQQISGQLGIKTIKTFYSTYTSQDGKATINIAQEASKYGMKVLLGVFEFKPGKGCDSTPQCEAWTQKQVAAAVATANTYPNTVIGIVVGNEDASDPSIAERIINDIKTIRSGLKVSLSFGIGTAQTAGTVATFIKDYHPNNLAREFIDNLDFLGINIYPFWDGASWGVSAKNDFMATFITDRTLLRIDNPNVRLVETEEGWPSSDILAAQRGYYQWWQSRKSTDSFSSFYFATYDKLYTGSADGYFGIFNFAGENKDNVNNGIAINVNNLMTEHALLLSCKNSKDPKNPICWPINGVASASRYAHNQSARVKLDKSIPDYLLVIVDNGTTSPAACIITKDKFVNDNLIELTWSPDGKGDQPCGDMD